MKKIAILLAAFAGFAGLPALAQQEASSPSCSLTGDLTYTSEYVFRGIQRASDAVTPSIEGALDDFYLGAWLMQPITLHQDNELDFYGGYKRKLTRALSIEGVGTYYWYPEATGSMTRQSYEAGAGLTYADYGVTVSAYGYFDFGLQAATVVGTLGYSFPIPRLGTSIDVDAYIGTVGSRDWTPDAPGPKIRQAYNYYGADLSVPYHISEATAVTAGLHYATNGNTPASVLANRFWVTLGVTTRF